MIMELKCGKTHVQLFHESECIATVRTEYAAVVKAAIEASLHPLANGYHTEEK